MYNEESKKDGQKEDYRSSHFRLDYKKDGRGKVIILKVVVTDRHFETANLTRGFGVIHVPKVMGAAGGGVTYKKQAQDVTK